jgi:hypothetical protein
LPTIPVYVSANVKTTSRNLSESDQPRETCDTSFLIYPGHSRECATMHYAHSAHLCGIGEHVSYQRIKQCIVIDRVLSESSQEDLTPFDGQRRRHEADNSRTVAFARATGAGSIAPRRSSAPSRFRACSPSAPSAAENERLRLQLHAEHERAEHRTTFRLAVPLAQPGCAATDGPKPSVR